MNVWNSPVTQTNNAAQTSDDRVFQASGPDVENARGPSVTVCVLGTGSWLSSADRSWERPETKVVGTRSLERYTGAQDTSWKTGECESQNLLFQGQIAGAYTGSDHRGLYRVQRSFSFSQLFVHLRLFRPHSGWTKKQRQCIFSLVSFKRLDQI